jgi:hypothetical protein
MKTLAIILFLLISPIAHAQKKFPKFTYTTVQGSQISNKDLIGKTSLVIVGHISCPGVLFLLKDLQNSAIDTTQVILLLDNTAEQMAAFNSEDTSNIWAYQRFIFKLKPVIIPTVTSCSKERITVTSNGAVVIKSQCNKMKFKYRAFNVPKLYAVNHSGRIINKQTGWYYNLPDPKAKLVQFLQGIK